MFVFWFSPAWVVLIAQTFSIDQQVIANGSGNSDKVGVLLSDSVEQLELGAKIVEEDFELLREFGIEISALNSAPTISNIADQTINEDQRTDSLRFSVADEQSFPFQLIVTARSSNVDLVPDANIFLSGSEEVRNIVIEPLPDTNGEALIILTVTDGELSSTALFQLTVLPVNDAPTLEPIEEIHFFEDAGAWVFDYSVNDIDSSLDQIAVNLTSDNKILFPPGSIFSTGNGSNRSIHLLPAMDQSGTALVTATASDGFDSTIQTFRVNIAGEDDSPVFSEIADITLPEGGSIVVEFFIFDPDTSIDQLVVNFSSSNPDLISDAGLVLSNTSSVRALTINPFEHQNGDAEITVTVTDGTNVVESTFTLMVTPVNDPPIVSELAHQIMNEDSVLSLDFQVGDLESEPGSLLVSVTSNNPVLFPDSGLSLSGNTADRRVTLLPMADRFGQATVTIRVSDGDLEVSTSFQVTVSGVNDLPSISDIEPLILDEDGSAQFAFQISDLETANDQLKVGISSSNTALFPTFKIDLTQELDHYYVVLTPEPDRFGEGLITIHVSDGQGVLEKNVSIKVEPIPDPPVISGISEVRFNEDSEKLVKLVVSDVDTPDEELSVSIRSDNPLLFSPDDLTFLNSDRASGSLVLKPLLNAFGTATVIVEVSDGELITSKEMSVRVLPVNDPPFIQSTPNQFFSSGGGAVMVPLVIRDVEQAVEQLEVSVSIDSDEFVVPDSIEVQFIEGKWVIRMMPLAGKTGVTRIHVTASDGFDSSSIYFAANFNVGNVPPVVTLPERLSFDEDQSISVFVPIVDDVLRSEQLELSVTSSLASLVSEADISLSPVEGGALLNLHPLPDQYGDLVVTVFVSDSLHVVSGEIPVEVRPVDDPPRITRLLDRTVMGPQIFEIVVQVSDPDSPLTPLTLWLESNFEDLIPVNRKPMEMSGSQAILSLAPKEGRFGIAEIAIRIQTLDGFISTERFQVQVTDPLREETPPVDIRLKRGSGGGGEKLILSWIGEMKLFVADQLSGPYRQMEGVTSPYQLSIKRNGQFYKLVPRSDQ